MDEKYKYTPDIKVENLEQHKEGVEEQLKQVQLLFCDKVYQEYRRECARDIKPIKKTFSDTLEDQHAYYTEDLRMLVRASNGKRLNSDEEYDLVLSKYYSHLDEIYNHISAGQEINASPESVRKRADELSILVDFIEAEKNKIKLEYPDAWHDMTERPRNESGALINRVGIIDFNPLKNHVNPEVHKMEEKLKEEGFSEFDDFLEIHMPSNFEVENKLGPDVIKASLANLAEMIIDKMPETRAVVAVSWLLDHPIFKRFIKMTVVGEAGSNWRQLISKDGQIDQLRVKKLFSDGRLPFRNLMGYIKVEDFLQEYLPKHRRGEIRLKKINNSMSSEELNFESRLRGENKAFGKTWDSGKLDTKEKVKNYMAGLNTLKGVMKQLGFYERFEAMMINNIGRSRQQINTENKEMINEFEIKYNNFIKEVNESRYIDEIIDVK